MLLVNWTKSTHSSRNAMLAALLLIGAVAVYKWIVAPHRSYLMAVEKYSTAVDDLASKNQIITDNVITKRKELKELRERFDQTRARLFEPIKAKEFLRDIPTLSEEAGCVVHSLKSLPVRITFNTGHSETNSRISAQSTTLSVGGNYRSVVALTTKLQDRLEQVRIDSVSIGSNRNNPGQLECDTTITIYVMESKEKGPHD